MRIRDFFTVLLQSALKVSATCSVTPRIYMYIQRLLPICSTIFATRVTKTRSVLMFNFLLSTTVCDTFKANTYLYGCIRSIKNHRTDPHSFVRLFIFSSLYHTSAFEYTFKTAISALKISFERSQKISGRKWNKGKSFTRYQRDLTSETTGMGV